jgi:RimJ/RimL family protein N-acetyltransferase
VRFANCFGACELDSIPGCSQLAISHGVFIRESMRGQRLGYANHNLRLERARNLHYDCVMATVDAANEKEKRNLKEMGWSCLHNFKNSKTGHTVEIWAINVSH